MRIIERILDNYFVNKFTNDLLHDLRLRYVCDFKIIPKNGQLDLYVKTNHSDHFEFVCGWRKEDALVALTRNRNNVYNFISKTITLLEKMYISEGARACLSK